MVTVPNTWGPGQLFAFSGMDGPTRAASPMVAHTLGERIGLRVFFEPAIEIWCQAIRGEDPGRRYPRCMPAFEIVTGDAIRAEVTFTDGRRSRIALAPLSQDVFAGYTNAHLAPRWSVGPSAGQPLESGAYVHRRGDDFAALVVREQGERVWFALAHDGTSAQAAIDKAAGAIGADLDAVIDRRKKWYESIEVPTALPVELAPTYRKAVAIMRVNTYRPEGQIRHRWTTPDRWPHRWMWLHDSAYHAVGHVYHFPDLAKDMLAAVFDTQEEDGRIALLMRPDGNFPGISQSPILAWAVESAARVDRAPQASCLHVSGPSGGTCAQYDREFLSAVYPKIRAYLEYFRLTRAFHDTGLYRWLHSDESMDNNPRFDHGSDFGAIDLSSTLCREFEAAAAMADALGLADDAAMWCEARQRTADAINARLWDDASGQYGDLMPDGRLVTLSACVTFLPLFAGIVPPDRAAKLRSLLTDPRKFWRTVPVATVAADEPTFYPDMWRGPTWLNMNHLISLGLEQCGFPSEADEIRRRSIDIVHKWCRHTGCIYEFYDCDDRIPPFAIDRKSRIAYGGGFTNVSDYHWSAALFVAMCRKLYGDA